MSDRAEQRSLGLFTVFSLAAGAMISSGLFVLPGIAFAEAGPAVVLSYLIAGLVTIPVVMVKAELSTAMPRSGGGYLFIERSMGPLFGTVAGLADWLAITLKATFALIGLGTIGTLLIPGPDTLVLKLTACGFGLFFTALNLRGARESGRLQVALVVGLLMILVYFIAEGLPSVDGQRFFPFTPRGWRSVFAVTGMVFVSYGGLTSVATVSGEIRDPARNLPRGMFLAFGIVNLLYVLTVGAVVGLVPAAELSGSLTPVALAARAIFGGVGLVLIEVAAFLAFATTANSGILAASRGPMAMSMDGLIPACFARTSERSGVPVAAVLATSGSILALIVALDVEGLVKTASTMMLLLFLLEGLALIVLRLSRVQNYKPTYRVPLFPLLPALPLFLYVFLIMEMGWVALTLSACFVLSAVIWTFAYVRPRVERESAFRYAVERMLNPSIQRGQLEEELAQIVIERDRIVHDRFDDLVKQCRVLDIEGRIDARELFRRVGETLADQVGVDAAEMARLLEERERQSSTILRPGLAVPHIIVPGEGAFEMLPIRAREGIAFGDLAEPVHTVFVLAGSLDERNFHLRALMNIAHIVQDEEFEKQWLEAPGEEHLRDLILMAKRRREPAAPKR
jgi:basic amino acid/polyamine antiporter, APA family